MGSGSMDAGVMARVFVRVLMDSKVDWPGNSSPLSTILPHSPPIRFGCDSNVCSQKLDG